MAFWHRITESKIRLISYQFKRYYFQVPYASDLNQTRFDVLGKPYWRIQKKPSDSCDNVRFFASPVQFQTKQNTEEPGKGAPFLNEQIKASIVRLVIGTEHRIVTRREALERARELKLDLVEVQKNADPPVCKIMDFRQERYKQQVKEKDRAKSKSEMTIKKGSAKEVRFTEKIEEKDLKMKADTVKRLMERGYRVKCMAMGKGKEDGNEDLGGLLSRLIDLIEDVTVVESGPQVEKKQAYAIVRHIKFGPSKKGGRKKSKAVGETSAGDQKSALYEDDSAESMSENEDEDDLPLSSTMEMEDKNVENKKGATSNYTKKEISGAQQTIYSPHNDIAMNCRPKQAVNAAGAGSFHSSHPETSPETVNRYKNSEPRNQFPPPRSMEYKGQVTREPARSQSHFTYERRQSPQYMNGSTSVQGRKEVVENDVSTARSSKPPIDRLQKHFGPDVRSTPASSYGIFSNAKANAPGNQGEGHMHRSTEANRFDSAGNRGTEGRQNFHGSKNDGSQRPSGDKVGQGGFGIFSREVSNTRPD